VIGSVATDKEITTAAAHKRVTTVPALEPVTAHRTARQDIVARATRQPNRRIVNGSERIVTLAADYFRDVLQLDKNVSEAKNVFETTRQKFVKIEVDRQVAGNLLRIN
jgi:hypothetical protein